MSTTPATTEIAAYTSTKAALAELRNKYEKAVYDVTTSSGMADAKAAKKELAAHRITLESARVREKAESLAYGRRVDSQAKVIADQIAALEDPIEAQIKAEERREEAARQAAILAEQQRLEAAERARKEAEERALAEQRAEIARQRAALEAEERERRRKLDEEEAASRKRIREEEDRARAVRQAEEDRLRAEREKVEAARREEEERQRKAREAEEAKVREVLRLQNELGDARTMLDTFRKRFGHRPEFVLVVEAIDECLEAA